MAELIPPRRSEFLTRDGVPTQRFAEYLEQLTSKTNSTVTTIVTASTNNSAVRAQMLALQEQVGSGDFLTWDDDGFTWDSDQFTFDQDEA
tara:strand:+ start:642 stop:911 length:270 start_codon:yes stop_codon:yes gene_type:complete